MAANGRMRQQSPNTALSLDIEWGELEHDEQDQKANGKPRPGSRAMSSRLSSARSSQYSYSTRSSYKQDFSDGNNQIQIIRDGHDDDEDWILEEYGSGDEGVVEQSSMSSEFPPNRNSIQTSNLYGGLYNQQIMPFSERYALQKLTFSRESSNSEMNIHDGNYGITAANQLAVAEIDSEEENDIVKKIREEITQQITNEAKSEAITYGNIDPPQEDEMDPKIKEALLQMRKFGKILEKRTRRERKVKRERIALQKRLRQELDELKLSRQDGNKSTKDEANNTEKFLALPASISRFDKDVGEYSDDDDYSFDPLFATQPPEVSSTHSNAGKPRGTTRRHYGASETTSYTDGTSENMTDRSTRRQRRRKKQSDGDDVNKDFIQRNIDLAADAGNTIAMTDDEKKRLIDILEDLDTIEENDNDKEDDTAASHQRVALKPGEGFHMDAGDYKSMSDIDKKLEQLMGQREFNSQLTTVENMSYESFFKRIHSTTNEDISRIGERALQETKEYREQQRRLADIEKDLAALSTAVQSEMDSPRLTNHQLNALLDQCRTTMSRATAETDSLANSPRSALNGSEEQPEKAVPHLDESVLKALLDQAKAEGIGVKDERYPTDQPDLQSESVHEEMNDR